jgi:hypothetical protein
MIIMSKSMSFKKEERFQVNIEIPIVVIST